MSQDKLRKVTHNFFNKIIRFIYQNQDALPNVTRPVRDAGQLII